MAQKRPLTLSDMERMQIPPRYYPKEIDTTRFPEILRAYLREIDSHVLAGRGLLLCGNNGIGKTTFVCAALQEARRHRHTALFVESAAIKDFIFQRTPFDAQESMIERMRSVQVLGIDDLGKERADGKGFNEQVFDELLRHRMLHRRVTLISTNVVKARLPDFLMKSTLEALRDCVTPLEIEGVNLRVEHAREARDALGIKAAS